VERLAIYPEYLTQRDGFIPAVFAGQISDMTDAEGLVKKEKERW
jgi:hypothetical protein